MPTTRISLFDPPAQSAAVDDKGFLSNPLRLFLFTIARIAPLMEVDTSGGPYSEALPPAGLNSTTGQSNQNQELIYVKTSADANVFTVTGAVNGAQTISAQYGVHRFKSDGTNWFLV